MRESEQTKLEYRLHQQIMASIITIQRWFRAVLERRRFLALRRACLVIQYCYRYCNYYLYNSVSRICRHHWIKAEVTGLHKLLLS